MTQHPEEVGYKWIEGTNDKKNSISESESERQSWNTEEQDIPNEILWFRDCYFMKPLKGPTQK